MPIARQASPRGTVPVAFDVTLATAGTAQNCVVVPAGLEGVSLDVDVSGHDARLAFDATAGPTSTRILVAEGVHVYPNVTIRQRVSFVGDGGGRPRIWGTLWCRRV